MTTIRIKRVYEAAEKSDGMRILVDRLWPRGIKKENLPYDLWAKNLTPSSDLREWFHEDIDKNWAGFKHKYVEELTKNPAVTDFIERIRKEKIVTLLYASKNRSENHASVLKNYLQSKL